MKIKTSYLILFLVFLTGFLNGLMAEDSSVKPEIKIGAILCLTGECAEWGNNSRMGIQLAVSEINAKGGILGHQIILKIEDTREGDGGANAIAAYQNLILDGDIKYIVGPTWSIGAAPLAPILAKKEQQIITSPSVGIADFNEAGSHLFNLWPHDSFSTEALAVMAINNGWTTAVIFDANDPWGVVQADTFQKKFEELGGQILKRISNVPGAPSFKGEALTVKKLNPKLVFHANMYKMSQFAKDLKRVAYNGEQISILMDETRELESQGALNGAYFAKYPPPSDEFIQKFKKHFGSVPGIAADTAYDIIYLYDLAITAANSFSPDLVKEEISKIKMSGASGELIFDSKGGVVKTPIIFQVQDGADLAILKASE